MAEETQVQEQTQQKVSDKELNFRALQQKYEKQLADERSARLEAERLAQERLKAQEPEEEDSNEPYVDHKRLNKRLEKFGQSTKSEMQKAIEKAKEDAKEELKQELWMEQNKDFYDVIQHAEKFAEKAPQLANSILRMPEGFERQKLVYENIKALGLHQPAKQEPSIQQKIDANRRSPYYQPSGVGTPAYNSQGDFSPSGQKNAYDKLQELKRNLRI